MRIYLYQYVYKSQRTFLLYLCVNTWRPVYYKRVRPPWLGKIDIGKQFPSTFEQLGIFPSSKSMWDSKKMISRENDFH